MSTCHIAQEGIQLETLLKDSLKEQDFFKELSLQGFPHPEQRAERSWLVNSRSVLPGKSSLSLFLSSDSSSSLINHLGVSADHAILRSWDQGILIGLLICYVTASITFVVSCSLPKCLSLLVDLATSKFIYHLVLQREGRDYFFHDTNKTEHFCNKCLQNVSFIKKHKLT